MVNKPAMTASQLEKLQKLDQTGKTTTVPSKPSDVGLSLSWRYRQVNRLLRVGKHISRNQYASIILHLTDRDNCVAEIWNYRSCSMDQPQFTIHACFQDHTYLSRTLIKWSLLSIKLWSITPCKSHQPNMLGGVCRTIPNLQYPWTMCPLFNG